MMQRLALVIVAAGSAACSGSTIQYVATNPAPRPLAPRPAQSVHIYSASLPAHSFVEVGIIQGRQAEGSTDQLPDVVAAMRQAAAERGCDALVIRGTSNEVVSRIVSVSRSSSTYTLDGLWGTCVVFTPAVAAPAS